MGIKTVEQIASGFGVSPDLVHQWRNQAQEALTGAFRNRNTRERNLESQVEALKSVVCKREMELEWLSKKPRSWGCRSAVPAPGKTPEHITRAPMQAAGRTAQRLLLQAPPAPRARGAARGALGTLPARSVPWSAQAARHAGARLRHPRGGKARSARARRDGFAHHLPASRHEPPRVHGTCSHPGTQHWNAFPVGAGRPGSAQTQEVTIFLLGIQGPIRSGGWGWLF